MKRAILGLICLILTALPAAAESVRTQLKTLETAVNITIDRLEYDIELEVSADGNFRETAGRQLQFSLLSLNAGHLLQEDYYHFALYLIARRFKQYQTAVELLNFEYEMTGLRALKNWLQQRIDLLQKLLRQPGSADGEFSIPGEFSSLRNLLKNFGLR